MCSLDEYTGVDTRRKANQTSIFMKLLSAVFALILMPSVPALESVPFPSHNSALKTILLVIPRVMDPSLSPMSVSRFNLSAGQNAPWKQSMKCVLLFEATRDMRGEGTRQRLDITALIRKRKKERKA